MVRSAGDDQHPSGLPFSPVFTLQVEDVLRGTAPPTIGFDGLRSGLPLRGERTCRRSSYLYAKLGDRIAVAFKGRIAGTQGPVTTATWIEGVPNAEIADPGLGTMGLNDVRLLMGLDPVPSFRAVLSGDAVSIEAGSITLDDVPAAAWSSDWPWSGDRSTNAGSWDLDAFLEGWQAHSREIDPPFVTLRFAAGSVRAIPGSRWATSPLRPDHSASISSIRSGLVAQGGHFGPTSLFIEIEADPTDW